MSGTLYVVATPIGNLEDVTLRALRVLREVSVIAAEDTRRTAKLLQHYGIPTPTVAFHEHSGPGRARQLLDRLSAGESIAVVSDAGTPGVCDPGFELIRAARERGIRVEPVPGASAVLAAIVASGFSMERFAFLGFAPSRAKDRNRWLRDVCGVNTPVIFFEAPHRILATLADLVETCGERPICVAREVTKVHEEFLVGSPLDVVSRLTSVKGEFTVVLGPASMGVPSREAPSDSAIARLFAQQTAQANGSRRSAVRELAATLGLSSKAVYEAIERDKNSGNREN